MASYLLDTTVLIEWLRNSPGAEERLLELVDSGASLAVCCVSVAEVFSGLLTDRDRDALEGLLADMKYWEISPSAARRAGELRFEWARKGRQIATPDALQAALALEQDEPFVTDNVKDFPMEGLRLIAFRH